MLAIEPMVADPAASDGKLASEVGTAIPFELPWIVIAWAFDVPTALSSAVPELPRISALPIVLDPAPRTGLPEMLTEGVPEIETEPLIG